MAMSMKKFLETYFKLVRLNEMKSDDIERWVQFESLVKKEDLTKNMADWAKLLKRDPVTGELTLDRDGFFELITLNPTELSDEDWEKLFLNTQNAMSGLVAQRKSYADLGEDDVVSFIDDNKDRFDKSWGETKEATPETEAAIGYLVAKLEDLLRKNPDLFRYLGLPYVNIHELRTKVARKEYNKAEFQKEIRNIAQKYTEFVYDDSKNIPGIDKDAENLADEFRLNNVGFISNDYAGWITPEVDPAKLADFKVHYPDFMLLLYRNQKVLDAFKQHEGQNNQISSAIAVAKEKVDYANPESKDYITPKRTDQLTLLQQIKKEVGDKYEDLFKKYTKFRGDRIYLNPATKDICKALDKSNIKPSDGLGKIVESASAIKGNLKGKNDATAAFNWLESTLKEFQSDPNMSKTFAGALKNGRQMKYLISELIMKAAKEAQDPKNGKTKEDVIKQVKIAMEVLSIIKYGNTTSKIMDAVRSDKDLFSIFSNDKLSWNKNAGVQFVTNALDKSVRAAFIGIGYGATFLTNGIRKSGSKFNQKFSNNGMRSSYAAWNAKNTTDKSALETKVADDRAGRSADALNRSANIRKQDTALVGLGIRGGGAADVDLKQKELDTKGRQDELKAQYALEPYEQILNQLQQVHDIKKKLEPIEAQEPVLRAAIMAAGPDKDVKVAELTALLNSKKSLIEQLENFRDVIDLGLIGGGVVDIDTVAVADIEAIIDHIQNVDPGYQNAVLDYELISQENAKKQQHINDFRKATEEIKNSQASIDRRDKELREWDKKHVDVYNELMAYWDFLETGRDSHTGPLYSWRFGSAENKQKPMRKDALTQFASFRGAYRAA